jgi:hypothetical protein
MEIKIEQQVVATRTLNSRNKSLLPLLAPRAVLMIVVNRKVSKALLLEAEV